MEILEHFGLALLGLLIYSLIAIKDNLRRFNFKIFWHDNKPFWAWAMTLQIVFAVLIHFYPESATAIGDLSGIDYTKPMAFLTSGGVLAGLANWSIGVAAGTEHAIGRKTGKNAGS